MTVLRTETQFRKMDKMHFDDVATIQERRRDAGLFLNYAASRIPKMCADARQTAELTINAFREKLGTDPVYAIEWADETFDAAGTLAVLGRISPVVVRVQWFVDGASLEPTRAKFLDVARAVQDLQEVLIEFARNSRSQLGSTSASSRAFAAAKIKATLEFAGSFGALARAKTAADEYLQLVLED